MRGSSTFLEQNENLFKSYVYWLEQTIYWTMTLYSLLVIIIGLKWSVLFFYDVFFLIKTSKLSYFYFSGHRTICLRSGLAHSQCRSNLPLHVDQTQGQSSVHYTLIEILNRAILKYIFGFDFQLKETFEFETMMTQSICDEKPNYYIFFFTFHAYKLY